MEEWKTMSMLKAVIYSDEVKKGNFQGTSSWISKSNLNSLTYEHSLFTPFEGSTVKGEHL